MARKQKVRKVILLITATTRASYFLSNRTGTITRQIIPPVHGSQIECEGTKLGQIFGRGKDSIKRVIGVKIKRTNTSGEILQLVKGEAYEINSEASPRLC